MRYARRASATNASERTVRVVEVRDSREPPARRVSASAGRTPRSALCAARGRSHRQAYRSLSSLRDQLAARGASTSCVCVTSAHSRPLSLRTDVCHTIVVRPRCSATLSPRTVLPTFAGAMNFVLESVVVVVAPGGRFCIVPSAPSVSANAMLAPPRKTPTIVHRSARTCSSPTTRSAESSSTVMPIQPGKSGARSCCACARSIVFSASNDSPRRRLGGAFANLPYRRGETTQNECEHDPEQHRADAECAAAERIGSEARDETERHRAFARSQPERDPRGDGEQTRDDAEDEPALKPCDRERRAGNARAGEDERRRGDVSDPLGRAQSFGVPMDDARDEHAGSDAARTGGELRATRGGRDHRHRNGMIHSRRRNSREVLKPILAAKDRTIDKRRSACARYLLAREARSPSSF